MIFCVREYQRRYYERNREGRLAQARAYRDANPEKFAAGARGWQKRNREHLAQWQREYRASNPEARERALKSNRDAKRLSRRLKALGLPEKTAKRTPARDRRANEAAAQEFFERPSTERDRAQLIRDYKPMDADTLAQWRERSPLARRRAAELEQFRSKAAEVVARQGQELREEVRMDAAARRARGLNRMDAAAELRQRVFDVAGGQAFLGGDGDRHSAALIVEEALEGHALPVRDVRGTGMIWVPEHTRRGQEVAGHWRRRPGG